MPMPEIRKPSAGAASGSDGTVPAWREPAVLLAVLALAAVVRSWALGEQPLWLDEGYTYWYARQSLAYLWRVAPTHETHPPLFFTLQKLWLVFGDGEAALRSLSVAASVLTVAAVFVLGRIVGGPRDGPWIAGVAAALFATAPLQIIYAREVRPYALLTLAATIALCGAAWLMRHPDRATAPGPPRRVAAAWLAVVLGTAGSLWLHNTAALFAAALGGIMAAWWWLRLGGNAQVLGSGLLAGACVLALWAPFLPHLWAQATTWSGGSWIPPPTPQRVWATALCLLGAFTGAPLAHVAGAALAAIGIGGAAAVRRGGDWPLAVLLLGTMLAPLALSVGVSLIAAPILLCKTLIYSAVPFYVGVARASALPAGRWARALIVTPVLAFQAHASLVHLETVDKEPWDRIVWVLGRLARPGDLVLLLPNETELVFDYYAQRRAIDADVVPLPAPFPAVGLPNPYPAGSPSVPAIAAADVPALEALIGGRERVWLVTRGEALFDPGRRVRGRLATLMRPRGAMTFRTGIRLYGFERP